VGFVFVVVVMVSVVLASPPKKEGMSWREMDSKGILPPFEFDNAPGDGGYSGNVDVPAAFYTFAANYCAPGGGVDQYGTGPFCSSSCSNCPCQETGGGSYNWCGYPYPCVGYDYVLSNFAYSVGSEQPGQPFVFVEYFDNYLNESQTTQFSDTQSTSNSYSWTFSRTLQDSLTISIDVGIPDVCEMHDSFSTSISMTTTEEQTKTDTKSWTVSQTITIPPLTTVKAEMIINTATFNIPYTADITMSGYAMTWCKGQVNHHWCWFIPPPYWLSSVSGCKNSDGGNATTCSFSGAFAASQGVTADVSVSKCALGVHC